MASKEEQRAIIMEELVDLKERETAHVRFAEGCINRDERQERLIKYGEYWPVEVLENVIAYAMGIAHYDLQPYPKEADLCAARFVFDGYVRTNRHVHATHKLVGYKKDDYAKIRLVVSRMTEQGYIKISKSGKGFRVLKTE